VRSAADLDAWLEESPAHRDSDLGFFLRFGRAIGLDRIGAGHDRYVSFGGLDIPEGSRVRGPNGGTRLQPAGFAVRTEVLPFDHKLVAEHVDYSWSADYEGGLHPFQGVTHPYATGKEGTKYSWAKAPRYDGMPAETGPLAEAVIAGDPLFVDLVRDPGPSALVRVLARIVRPATLIPALDTWLAELTKEPGPPCPSHAEVVDGEGAGLIEATRGALGHWVRLEGGKISRYQIITPTGWNGSPRDAAAVRGPWEEALVGTVVADPENPVELGYVVRSFDPCLVCTVHTFDARLRSRGARLRLR
jgi:hydrogenase large subunit